MTICREILKCAVSDTVAGVDGFERTFSFPKDFVGFQGHFPGQPILPGFIQLILAEAVLEEQLHLNLTLCTVRQAKFMRIVEPEERLTVQWHTEMREDRLEATLTLLTEQGKASAFKLSFETAGKQAETDA